jgi:hypothetical protein
MLCGEAVSVTGEAEEVTRVVQKLVNIGVVAQHGGCPLVETDDIQQEQCEGDSPGEPQS